MPLGGGVADIATMIGDPCPDVFRRAYIQRRSSTTGRLDGTWMEITRFVKRWGTLETAVDDVRLNAFRHSGANLVVRNDTGAFTPETNPNSLWSGTLTRYRTLVRINAGYLDGAAEVPGSDSSAMGIFVLDDELPMGTDNNDVTMKCSSLQSIFDEVRARDISGITSTLTASDIMARIRDHTDGAGLFVFREFITSTLWSIASTTSYYNMTTTTLESLKTWELMRKLAEAEGYYVFITRSGGLQFQPRAARQSSSQFALSGQGFPRPNVIKIDEYRQAVNKLYTYIRFKHLEADTSTSYVSAGTTTVVSPSNTSWVYGSRVYEFENLLTQNTAAAQTLANALFTEYGTVRYEASLKCKFVPHLEILDRVDVSYRSYDLAGQTIWDAFDWASDAATQPRDAEWATEGENFDWYQRAFFLLSRKTDLDNFTTTFAMREI